jgi:hypothetical protein
MALARAIPAAPGTRISEIDARLGIIPFAFSR